MGKMQVEVNGEDVIEGKAAKAMGNYKTLMKMCPLYKELGEQDLVLQWEKIQQYRNFPLK